MGIARGVAKAAKAAKKQTRGLTGNRNSQGDFMTGENKLDTDRFAGSEMMARDKVADSVTPDIQLAIQEYKVEFDDMNTRIQEAGDDLATVADINREKLYLLNDLIDMLEEKDVAVPGEIVKLRADTIDLLDKDLERVNNRTEIDDTEPYDIDMTDEDKGIRYAEPVRQGYGMDDESLY